MNAYRERELKRRIKIHELQIAKHRKRIARAQDKISICETELKGIQEVDSYLSQFDSERLKGKDPDDVVVKHVKDYLKDRENWKGE